MDEMYSDTCCPETAPEMNALLDTLGHHVRREIVASFETGTVTETTIDELVRHLDGRLLEQSATRLQIALVHKHLPKLADREWLDYDRQTGQIRHHGHDDAARLTGKLHDLF